MLFPQTENKFRKASAEHCRHFDHYSITQLQINLDFTYFWYFATEIINLGWTMEKEVRNFSALFLPLHIKSITAKIFTTYSGSLPTLPHPAPDLLLPTGSAV